MQQCLMLGSGRSALTRRLATPFSLPESETSWTSLDIDPDCDPDVVFDLENLEDGQRLPFPDETFDEIHAYEVLPSFGEQGDMEGFFNTFGALWRALKPKGFLVATVPAINGPWMHADPASRRVIHPVSIRYLTLEFYDRLGKEPLADYRKYVDGRWWKIVHDVTRDGGYHFGLQKVKQ